MDKKFKCEFNWRIIVFVGWKSVLDFWTIYENEYIEYEQRRRKQNIVYFENVRGPKMTKDQIILRDLNYIRSRRKRKKTRTSMAKKKKEA